MQLHDFASTSVRKRTKSTNSKYAPQVALRARRRGLRDGTRPGDVVQYVLCTSASAAAAHAAADAAASSNETPAATPAGTGGLAERAFHVQEVQEAATLEVDTHYYLAQQLHPVVARLCAPLEATSDARLAECLGLDPAKFRANASGGGNGPADPFAGVCSAAKDHALFMLSVLCSLRICKLTVCGLQLCLLCSTGSSYRSVGRTHAGTLYQQEELPYMVLQMDAMAGSLPLQDEDDCFADVHSLQLTATDGATIFTLPDIARLSELDGSKENEGPASSRAAARLLAPPPSGSRAQCTPLAPAQLANQVRHQLLPHYNTFHLQILVTSRTASSTHKRAANAQHSW